VTETDQENNSKPQVGGALKDRAESRETEARLLETESRLRTIIQSEPECVKLLDRKGTLVEINPAGLAMIEADSFEQVAHAAVDALVLPAHRPAFVALTERVFAGGSGTLEFEIEGLKGTRRWLETHAVPLRDSQGKVTSLLAITRDISERKKSEAAQLERVGVALFHRDIAIIFTDGGSLQNVLQRCAEALVEHLKGALVQIWTVGADEATLELQASAGMCAHIEGSYGRVAIGKTKIGMIASERRPYLTDAVVGDESFPDQPWARREHIRAFAGYPLIVEDHLVGVVGLFAREPLNPGALGALSGTMVALAQEISRKQDQARLQARNLQQAAVARLGQAALTCASLDDLLNQSVALIAEVLEVEYVKVLELLPSGENLLLRAGVGWHTGSVGTVTMGSGRDSQAGYTLASKEPVIVDDLQSETRFSAPALLHDHGVKSGMSVVIGGDKLPFGVLGVHTARRRRFSADDVHFAESVANILAETIQREHAAKALRRSNRMLMTLSRCNETLAQAGDEESFLTEVCRIITEVGGYRLAWIGFAEHDARQSVRVAAQSGYDDGYLDSVTMTWGSGLSGAGPTGRAIRAGEPAFARDILTDPDFAVWRGEAQRRGFASSAALPLVAAGTTLGALNIYAADRDAFDEEETRLLKNLADDVAFGITALREKADRLRAEQALKQSEQRFRALIENATDLITVLDQNGVAHYQSPSVERILGYLPGEILGTKVFDLIHPEDLGAVLETFAAALQNEGGSYSVDFRFRHKDGTWRYLESNGRSLLHAMPIQGVIINSRDVTDRKQTERRLHESEENLRQLTDNIAEVFWLTNPDKSEMIYISPAYEKIWGRTRDSVYASPISWVESIHPEDRPRIVRAAMAKQVFDDYDEEYRIVRPDGEVRYIRDRAFPISDSSGKIYRIAGVAEDITERKRAETALAEHQRQLSTLIGNLPGLVYRCRNDAQYTTEFVSDGIEELTGYPASEFHERRRHFVDFIDPRDRERVWEQVQAALEQNGPFELVYRIRSAAGVEKWVWERGVGVRDSAGKLQALEGFVTDVSELKRAEEVQRRAYAELEKSNKVKSEFLSVMSHELRTPLNVIMGYTTMIKEYTKGEMDRVNVVALEKIDNQAKDLLAMVNRIMDATVIESGNVRAEVQDVHVGTLLEQLRSMYDYPREKDVGLIWRCPSSLPGMRTDPVKLKHILQNLINNALKFTEKGAVTVAVQLRSGDFGLRSSNEEHGVKEIRQFIEFAVADTGSGIPPESLPAVFDMFHQVDSSATREYGGIGLGLYIAKKYTELLGGAIAVKSKVGEGSVFTVTLPLALPGDR
jgi:PAS domain S-box-containing protein